MGDGENGRKKRISGLGRGIRRASHGLNRAILRLHDWCIRRHARLTLLLTFILYPLLVLLTAGMLHASANFFVLLPVLVCALTGGLPGGLLAGALGLPANLLLFWLAGHPDAAPRSPVMAELSGLLIGISLGFLTDHFRRVGQESARRRASGQALLASLGERDALLDELDHRVRNNLSLIRSMIRLQARRRTTRSFAELAETIDRRIMAISLVYTQLQVSRRRAMVDARSYLARLLHEIGESRGLPNPLEDCLSMAGPEIAFSLQTATAVGLIVNEAVGNACQHGLGTEGRLDLAVRLEERQEQLRLQIVDRGPGFDPASVDGGLGIDLIALQVAQIGGTHRFNFANGTELLVDFPAGPGIIVN